MKVILAVLAVILLAAVATVYSMRRGADLPQVRFAEAKQQNLVPKIPASM